MGPFVDRLILPILMPVGVVGATALLIVGIGTLLLAVGEPLAVPVAITLALGILLVGAFLASRPAGA